MSQINDLIQKHGTASSIVTVTGEAFNPYAAASVDQIAQAVLEAENPALAVALQQLADPTSNPYSQAGWNPAAQRALEQANPQKAVALFKGTGEKADPFPAEDTARQHRLSQEHPEIYKALKSEHELRTGNPWLPESNNLTHQAMIESQNPERAQQLKKQAERTILDRQVAAIHEQQAKQNAEAEAQIRRLQNR